jgi:hypothetical protein
LKAFFCGGKRARGEVAKRRKFGGALGHREQMDWRRGQKQGRSEEEKEEEKEEE